MNNSKVGRGDFESIHATSDMQEYEDSWKGG